MNSLPKNDVEKIFSSLLPQDLINEIVEYYMPIFTKMDIKFQEKILSTLIGNCLLPESVVLHPVTFELIWKPFHFDMDPMTEYLDEYIEDQDQDHFKHLSEMCLDEMKSWNWDTVPFPGVTQMFIENKSGGNSDTRGGGCGKLISPKEFKYTIDRDTGITMGDIMESVYRMKGSKYDWWYELFTALIITNRTDTSISLEVCFDHGS